MLSCQTVLLFIDARFLASEPSAVLCSSPFLFFFTLLSLLTGDGCVVCFKGIIGLAVGKSEGQMGDWKLGILRLGNTLAKKT